MQRARSERNDARETVDALTAEIELLKPQLAAAEEKLRAASTRADDAERDAREMKSAKEKAHMQRSGSTRCCGSNQPRRHATHMVGRIQPVEMRAYRAA